MRKCILNRVTGGYTGKAKSCIEAWGNLESGSFSYLRNSVNDYTRNSAEFRVNFTVKIPRNSVKSGGIPYVFLKIPYSAGSKNSTSVDTLGTAGNNYQSID
jgi:hypothetical protein